VAGVGRGLRRRRGDEHGRRQSNQWPLEFALWPGFFATDRPGTLGEGFVVALVERTVRSAVFHDLRRSSIPLVQPALVRITWTFAVRAVRREEPMPSRSVYGTSAKTVP